MQYVNTVRFAWLGETAAVVEWRSALEDAGEQYVMISGMKMMPL